METRLVTHEIESRVGGKALRSCGEGLKRCWKYGEAARNMFLDMQSELCTSREQKEAYQAHSIDMPSSKKIPYSSQEKGSLCEA